MKCPKCKNNKLRSSSIKGTNVTVDYCQKCKGIWFDNLELPEIIDSAVLDLKIPSNAVRLKIECPKCAKPLYTFQYSQTNVAVEMCRKCKGLWLDHREFQRIRQAREKLEKAGMIDEYEQVQGIKAPLIRFIDAAIERIKQDL